MRSRELSAPNENVRFVPNRNVRLTRSGWGGARTRSSDHGPAGSRPVGSIAELKPSDSADRGGRSNWGSRRGRTPAVAAHRTGGDRAMVHGLRGRASNRKTSAEKRAEAVRILSQQIYRGFGPTLAAEYLAKRHELKIGRESLRQIMIQAGLWRRAAESGSGTRLASAPKCTGRVGAMGHFRSRLAGRARRAVLGVRRGWRFICTHCQCWEAFGYQHEACAIENLCFWRRSQLCLH